MVLSPFRRQGRIPVHLMAIPEAAQQAVREARVAEEIPAPGSVQDIKAEAEAQG